MGKNATTAEIIEAIKNSNSILISGHTKPDGDCIGSAFAMRIICEKLGKSVDAVCDVEKSPESYSFLPDFDRFCKRTHDKYDLAIAVDCADDKRLGNYIGPFYSAKNSIVIDHHPKNEGFGKLNHIDSTASSTCAILYELFRESELIDVEVARCLYTGLSTDTGHFMHSNTDEKVFRIAADLSSFGFDVGKLNRDLYCSKSIEKIKLTASALSSIRLHEGGRIAIMTLTAEDLARSGCTPEDTEGLIDHVKSIKGVEIAISMCEQRANVFRVSLRSVAVDVSAVAGTFGGGGHKLASGCIVNGMRYDVEEKVLKAAVAALK